jgi:hypothetical protein
MDEIYLEGMDEFTKVRVLKEALAQLQRAMMSTSAILDVTRKERDDLLNARALLRGCEGCRVHDERDSLRETLAAVTRASMAMEKRLREQCDVLARKLAEAERAAISSQMEVRKDGTL